MAELLQFMKGKQMKILLVAINAKYIHSNLAVYSLKAYAEKYIENYRESDHHLEIAEYTINQYSDFILRDIYERKPDVVCFSCYIWNISMVQNVCEDLSKVLPDVDLWLGGPEVSYNAVEVLEKNKHIRGIMRGEGEKIFKHLAAFYMDAKDILELKNIKGLTYRVEDDIVSTEDEEIIELSEVPFVYGKLSNFENRIIYYESSRGCPFSCSYCLSSIDKRLRFRDVKLVKEELEFFLDHRVAQVKFVDRTFNCKKSHADEIWRFIRENDNGVTNFHFEIAADILSDEEIEIIRTMRPGLIQLEIGVQTTNPETIHQIDRVMDFDKVAEVVNKLRSSHNVHLHLDLIAGLPKEGIQSFKNSFNMVYHLRPEQLQLGFLKVLHGSKIEHSISENEMQFQSRPPYEVFSTKWLAYEDILRLKNVEEVLEIYYNSGQFDYSIQELEKYFDTAFDMFDALGQFYRICSEKAEKHSRIQRYEILLQFFRNKVVADQRANERFRQLLVLDLYLRENVKSRPEFADSQDCYKKQITSIYIKEAEERRCLPDYNSYNSKQLAKMTHVEVFDFDIFQYIEQGVEHLQETYVLFDYKNRNPLNYSARITEVILKRSDKDTQLTQM